MSLFTRKRSESVASLGETALITDIRRWLGSAAPESPHGMGDDCAQLPISFEQQLITVDPVVYGRHFDDEIAPRHVGAKLLKRNLSDIAAMGGQPTAAVIALTLDPLTKLAWLEAFYRGLAACARKYQVKIVGGISLMLITTSRRVSPCSEGLIRNACLPVKVRESEIRSTSPVVWAAASTVATIIDLNHD